MVAARTGESAKPLAGPRIGLDFREAFREEPRGIGLYCRHLMREFGALSPPYHFELYHERPRPKSLGEIPEGMRANPLGMKGGRFHLWERLALPLRLRSDGVQLYHGTYNTLPPRLPLLGAPKLVVTLHDVIVTWFDDDLDDPYVRYVRKVQGRVIRQADAIVTVSEFSKQDILERFDADPSKVHVIYNGIHPLFHEDSSEADRQSARERLAGGKPYLFSIGSMLRRKNTDILFEVLRVLLERGVLEDEVLVLTGLEGPALEARRAAAQRSSVLERVRFHGYQSWEELRAAYAGAELAIYPSLVEGWGIPVVEALACGTPIATSKSTAMPEAGGEFANYFDPENLEDVIETVARSFEARKGFLAQRDAAKAHARSFSWTTHAKSLLELYARLLES